jgi:hypothetical protein
MAQATVNRRRVTVTRTVIRRRSMDRRAVDAYGRTIQPPSVFHHTNPTGPSRHLPLVNQVTTIGEAISRASRTVCSPLIRIVKGSSTIRGK